MKAFVVGSFGSKVFLAKESYRSKHDNDKSKSKKKKHEDLQSAFN